jgi:uncharacterized membrane protein YkoI
VDIVSEKWQGAENNTTKESHVMNAMRKIAASIVVLVGVMAVSVPAWSGRDGKQEMDETKEAVELSKTAKVTIEQAVKTATEKLPGKVIEAELEKKHGKGVWEVEIVGADGKVTEVHVDADTGAVIDMEEKSAQKKSH